MKILVAGAGYLGLPLALSLKEEGHSVWGWTHSENSALQVSQAGLESICGDLAAIELWQKYPPAWDAIFYCPSTSGGGVESYQRLHRDGLANARQFLAGGGRFFYTSSTSVYGQDDGSEVDEFSTAEPRSEGSKILREAEETVLALGGTVLRLAGIYGPGRCVYLRKMEEGRAIIPGDGSRWVNQIHRHDALSAMRFLWESKLAEGIWNVADDEPVSLKELYRWISGERGRPMPETGGEEGPRKRGMTHKRVLNGKLRNAGWRPKYPTFREGYAELIRGGG